MAKNYSKSSFLYTIQPDMDAIANGLANSIRLYTEEQVKDRIRKALKDTFENKERYNRFVEVLQNLKRYCTAWYTLGENLYNNKKNQKVIIRNQFHNANLSSGFDVRYKMTEGLDNLSIYDLQRITDLLNELRNTLLGLENITVDTELAARSDTNDILYLTKDTSELIMDAYADLTHTANAFHATITKPVMRKIINDMLITIQDIILSNHFASLVRVMDQYSLYNPNPRLSYQAQVYNRHLSEEGERQKAHAMSLAAGAPTQLGSDRDVFPTNQHHLGVKKLWHEYHSVHPDYDDWGNKYRKGTNPFGRVNRTAGQGGDDSKYQNKAYDFSKGTSDTQKHYISPFNINLAGNLITFATQVQRTYLAHSKNKDMIEDIVNKIMITYYDYETLLRMGYKVAELLNEDLMSNETFGGLKYLEGK